ncbi:FHA domain-containing protein [Corallococcus exiguus]|uniref:FHA domain-containing protein n=1 Tax=Corallococcus exiguus TaxID=83462 RepID=UPI001471265A|nr:FHA domain-containing protein [Corallococcus exiguus]NNB89611.1 FHA domain-containing protein [Corallococcus exiguus]
MNRIRETIEIAEPLWRALEQMSHDLGVDRNALVAQALFMLARQNGYVAPTPVALGETDAGEPVRAPAARAPEPVVRVAERPAAAVVPAAVAVPAAAVVPAKETVAAAPAAAAVSEPVKAQSSVDEAAHARARMQEVLAAVDAVSQPRDVPVASDDEEEADEEEESDSDEDSDDEESDDEAADESSDDDESDDEAADESSDDDESDDEAADESSDDEESDDESSDDEESEEEDLDDKESDDHAADEASDDGSASDAAASAGADDEDESQSSEEDDASAADIAAAIGSEERPGADEDDDSEPEEAKTGEEATGSEEDDADDEAAAQAAASDEDAEQADAPAEDEEQDSGSNESEEQDLPFVAPPAAKAPAARRQGRVLRPSETEDDAPPDANRGRKPAPAARATARMDLFVRLSPDGPSTRVDVERFTLGRGPQCSLVVKSGRVSREHAIVVRDGADYFIEDLGSSNGTWINHQRIKRQKIADGDTFNLGTEAVYFSLQPAED